MIYEAGNWKAHLPQPSPSYLWWKSLSPLPSSSSLPCFSFSFTSRFFFLPLFRLQGKQQQQTMATTMAVVDVDTAAAVATSFTGKVDARVVT